MSLQRLKEAAEEIDNEYPSRAFILGILGMSGQLFLLFPSLDPQPPPLALGRKGDLDLVRQTLLGHFVHRAKKQNKAMAANHDDT